MSDKSDSKERTIEQRAIEDWEPFIITTPATQGDNETELLRKQLTAGFDMPHLWSFFIEEMFSRSAELGSHTDAEINGNPFRTEKKGKVNFSDEIFDIEYSIESSSRRLTLSKHNNSLTIEYKTSADLPPEEIMQYRLEGNNTGYLDALRDFLDEKLNSDGLCLLIRPGTIRKYSQKETGGFAPELYNKSLGVHTSSSQHPAILPLSGKETEESDKGQQNYKVVRIQTRNPVRCIPCADPERQKFETCKECLEYFSALEKPTRGDMLGPYWKHRKGQ